MSMSQGTQKDVSRPPENAKRMGLAPARVEGVIGLSSENGAQAHLKFALLARAGGGDEYGVVAGNGAYHLGPAGGVDGHGHALRGADGRLQYHEVAACRLQRVDELLEGREIALRVHRGF